MALTSPDYGLPYDQNYDPLLEQRRIANLLSQGVDAEHDLRNQRVNQRAAAGGVLPGIDTALEPSRIARAAAATAPGSGIPQPSGMLAKMLAPKGAPPPQPSADAAPSPTPLIMRTGMRRPTDDLGLAANQRTAGLMDDAERAYTLGAGRPDESGSALRKRLGFSWGKGVQLGANGRPVDDSVIQDPADRSRYVRANESGGGGGVSTVTSPAVIPDYMIENEQKTMDLADPLKLSLRRALAGIDVEKANAIDAGKSDVSYASQARAMDDLARFDRQADAEVDSNLARLRARPDFQGLDPEEKKKREATIQAAGEAAKTAQRQRYGLASGKATTTFKAGETLPGY